MSRSPVKRNPDWNAIRRDDLDDYRNRQIVSVHYHAENQLDNLKEATSSSYKALKKNSLEYQMD